MIPTFLKRIASCAVTDRADDLRSVLWLTHRSTISLRGEFTARELHQMATMMDVMYEPISQDPAPTGFEVRRAG
jgi:hypothetical protein